MIGARWCQMVPGELMISLTHPAHGCRITTTQAVVPKALGKSGCSAKGAVCFGQVEDGRFSGRFRGRWVNYFGRGRYLKILKYGCVTAAVLHVIIASKYSPLRLKCQIPGREKDVEGSLDTWRKQGSRAQWTADGRGSDVASQMEFC